MEQTFYTRGKIGHWDIWVCDRVDKAQLLLHLGLNYYKSFEEGNNFAGKGVRLA